MRKLFRAEKRWQRHVWHPCAQGREVGQHPGRAIVGKDGDTASRGQALCQFVDGGNNVGSRPGFPVADQCGCFGSLGRTQGQGIEELSLLHI